MSEQEERILRLVGDTPECGSTLLNDVRAFIRRFCVFPDDHCLNAVTLWAAHAHMVEHFYSTPRLAMLSPEPSSGKTRVLDVLDLLVPEPMYVFNASPAAIFRTLDSRQITLLFDEGRRRRCRICSRSSRLPAAPPRRRQPAGRSGRAG